MQSPHQSDGGLGWEGWVQTEGAAAREIADGCTVTMLLLCGLAAALASVVAWRTARSITRPMADAVRVFAAVADGESQRAATELPEVSGRLQSVTAQFRL